ncbi:Lytic polysaccharide mono-oxygenase cellulose-degrading [Gracilaria domingensis]|nr:Lytic polysaccharide mono-oxygenase cellulose-degrading [Gracilaria domingensis]
MQFHICDVAKCGGEISEDCFRQGHCYALRRAPNPNCDSGFDKQCAPIDRNYPLRWYLPCATKPENTQERMGNNKMTWLLPDDLVCDHCVLHWFWSAANTCNPPGVIDFYDGPDRPRNWGQCFGQSGARGGVTRVQKPCGPTRNPEEYYQCADVRILPRTNRNGNAQRAQQQAVSAASVATVASGNSVLTQVQLFADGKVVRVLGSDSVVDVSSYRKLTLEVVATREISKVDFIIDGNLAWTDWTGRYFLYGNQGNTPNYWPNPIFNRKFRLRVAADEEGDAIELQLTLKN